MMGRSFSDVIAMGGYAGFVWTAYGAWLVVIVLNILAARKAHADALKQVRRRLAMRDPANVEVDRS